MTTVIDASVAVRWFVFGDADPDSWQLLEGTDSLIAPDIVIPQVINGLWKLHRVPRLSAEAVTVAADSLPQLFESVVPSRELIAAAWKIAEAYDHSAYDCLYVALADATNRELVTADAKLSSVCQSSSVPFRLLGPT